MPDAAIADAPEAPVDATTRTDELAEILDILTPGRGGHYDPRRIRFDPTWNPKRVRRTDVRQDGTTFTLRGNALTTADLGQFRDRLKASRLFRDVTIWEVEMVDDFPFRLTLTAPGADPRRVQIFDRTTWKRP